MTQGSPSHDEAKKEIPGLDPSLTILQELRQEFEKFHLKDSSPVDFIFTVNSEGIITQFSSRVDKAHWYSSQEVVGKSLLEFIGPSERSDFFKRRIQFFFMGNYETSMSDLFELEWIRKGSE